MISEIMKNSVKITIYSIIITTVLFLAWMTFFYISAITNSFLLIETGKLTGPVCGEILSITTPVLFLISASLPILGYSRKKPDRELIAIISRQKKRVMTVIIAGLVMSFLITAVVSIPMMSEVRERGKKIDVFVAHNSAENLPLYVQNLTDFLNQNLNNSYNRKEATFEIDSKLSQTLIDPFIMNLWSVTTADIILYQHWGSCGQAAILLSQVMHESGLETRIAHFKGIDHAWAEVNNGTNWLIIDPWYIGNMIDISTLRNVKPEFDEATAVEVQSFSNTEWVDASKEHGY